MTPHATPGSGSPRSAPSLPVEEGSPSADGGFAVARGALAHLPALAALVLVALSLTPRFQSNPGLATSTLVAGLLLLAAHGLLEMRIRRGRGHRWVRRLARKQHWIQALVQLSVFAYWGWYWRPVYDFAPLLIAQLAFAYGFDMLLAWWRRDRYVLGFGPVPIILSINLFLWFRDDWFYLQFLMIAVGFLGKEFVRWDRDGRRVHIFNPSAFTLGLFSLVLIATHGTDLTWGREIASTLTLAPWIYLFLFGAGLVVMYHFSITLVAASAALTLFALSALYMSATGVPYFVDSEIPAAVFLGLHLLITDPSTSPRAPLGKALFGVFYGAGVFALYAILSSAGAPTFYDKLLCVPLLNLSVRGIDGLVQRLDGVRVPLGANPTHMGLWVLFFLAMTAMGKTDGTHPGDRLPFWEEACAAQRRNACARLLGLEATYCGDASGWACNELGIHYREGRIVTADPTLARSFLARACELRFQAACLNLLRPDATTRSTPRELDLRLLLREGGRNLMALDEARLNERACAHGWVFACSARGAR